MNKCSLFVNQPPMNKHQLIIELQIHLIQTNEFQKATCK